MIIYEATKREFIEHVEEDLIEQKIYEVFRNKIGRTSKNEINSWNHSMQYMYKVLNTQGIPEEASVAIEYRLPATSKRVDFIISGESKEGKDTVIIIELKQWQEVEAVDKPDIVKTYVGGAVREVAHPSYQAWSYACIIKDYNETVQKEDIELYPCAYMHNYISNEVDPIIEEETYPCIQEAPLFKSGDVKKLRGFIERHIHKADRHNILYKIEYGKIKPSKSLQDALVSMLKGNEEFVMIDSQKVAYETILKKARQAYKTDTKEVLIIKGGPGTGKSVLAINLLVQLTAEEMVCQYISKNSAPREVYKEKLLSHYRKKFIDNLFKGSGNYFDVEENEFDVLVVDEAHRLNQKSGMFNHLGENQMKEIINASKCAVFFIDEYQRVTAKDAGKIADIKRFAELSGASITEMELDAQFRCGGSDGYLAWLDDVLEIRETANSIGFEGDYEVVILDSPHQLKEMILEKNAINNKARIVAGYCWDWIKEGKNNTSIHDINIESYDFSMSWNLGNSTTWAIDKESVHEAGCIHTCQGLEFDYVGVIIGTDLVYRNGRVVTDYTKRARTDQSLKGLKGLCKKGNQEALELADEIIRNTYRTLMTRGQKGCYIFCEDKALAEYLKERIQRRDTYNLYEQMEEDVSYVAEAITNDYV